MTKLEEIVHELAAIKAVSNKYSYKELAEIINIPENTLFSRIKRKAKNDR